MYFFLIFLFLIFSAVLCFVILIQESKSMGLGASLGGDAGNSVFGTSTAQVLKKLTAWMAVIFVVSCLGLSLWSSVKGGGIERHKSVNIVETYQLEG